MIAQGMLHLLTGYDHLAFLFVALLAVTRRQDANDPRPLRTAMVESLKVITAFTVAHSITLTLAATGLVVFGSKPVEASIAATVAVTALLGFWKGEALNRRAAWRWSWSWSSVARVQGWPLAFAFGLVHGFGFAGALAEIIGNEVSALSVGSFNLGIELAQIGIALAIVPVLYLLARRRAFERLAAPAISAMVGGVAVMWLVERLA